jgi:threonine dehydrogenase-like Zn-dependent dehydrogenase
VKAAVLTAPRTIELVDTEVPPVGPGQARLRILQCGVCTSELDLWTGRDPAALPTRIGHEIAGVVEETGPGVSGLAPGQRVAAWVPGGGFAEQAVVEERFCVPVAPHVTFPAVAEPLACVVNAVELAAPALADDVVIIGAGFMGALVQMVTGLKGPRTVTVADLRNDALDRAGKLGATRVVNTATESLADAVGEVTDGIGADLSYEITGVSEGLRAAGEVTRMSGKVCVVAYHQGGTREIPLGRWNWMAFHIVNAHFRDIDTIMRGMRAGMRLVNAGILDVAGLMTHTFPLADIAEAFEVASARPEHFVKAVVEPGTL